MEYGNTITMIYIGVGLYSLTMGTYLFLREETRLYGIVFYLGITDEIALYTEQMVVFYAVTLLLIFWISALVTYEISIKHRTEEESQKIAVYTGFAFANIGLLVLGVFVWNILISVALSLLAFELTMVAVGDDIG